MPGRSFFWVHPQHQPIYDRADAATVHNQQAPLQQCIKSVSLGMATPFRLFPLLQT